MFKIIKGVWIQGLGLKKSKFKPLPSWRILLLKATGGFFLGYALINVIHVINDVPFPKRRMNEKVYFRKVTLGWIKQSAPFVELRGFVIPWWSCHRKWHSFGVSAPLFVSYYRRIIYSAVTLVLKGDSSIILRGQSFNFERFYSLKYIITVGTAGLYQGTQSLAVVGAHARGW